MRHNKKTKENQYNLKPVEVLFSSYWFFLAVYMS